MAKKEVSAAAEKVAQAEKEAKKAGKQTHSEGNIFQRAGKAIKKFFKDLRGEVKKIVWPDAKTVQVQRRSSCRGCHLWCCYFRY
ncbi:MAG: preprotein translocase subunit SecE [Clostridia bacterium]|nr:preprotein translocase subunit SecE [Clostridia bacterium]